MKSSSAVVEYISWARVLGVLDLPASGRPAITYSEVKLRAQERYKTLKPVFEKLAEVLKSTHKTYENNCNYGVSEGWMDKANAKMIRAGKIAAITIAEEMRVTFGGEYKKADLIFEEQQDPRGWPLLVRKDPNECSSRSFRPFMREYT